MYLSLRILPARMRAPMSLAYLFCRAADTLSDCGDIAHANRVYLIKVFPDIFFDGAKRGDIIDNINANAVKLVDRTSEKMLLKSLDKCFSAFDALGRSEKKLIQAAAASVCEGMGMDLRAFPDRTCVSAMSGAVQLEKYCRLIGGGPGIFWTQLYNLTTGDAGKTDKNPGEADGRMIGEALQITNILKDLADDLKIGRCYLPSDELSAAGLSPENLLDPDSAGKLKPVIAKWTLWAACRLDASLRYIASIPGRRPRARAAVIWPVYWALDTLSEIISERRLLDPRKKIKIPRKKIYAAILGSHTALISNSAFEKGYFLRRKNLFLKL